MSGQYGFHVGLITIYVCFFSTLVDLKVNVDGNEVALKVSPEIYEKAIVENGKSFSV